MTHRARVRARVRALLFFRRKSSEATLIRYVPPCDIVCRIVGASGGFSTHKEPLLDGSLYAISARKELEKLGS